MKKSFVLILITCFFASCVSLNLSQNETQKGSDADPTRETFLKGQSLALTGDYEQAIPFLMQTLQKKNSDEEQALILLARCHDQMSQPEKTILVLTELLAKQLDPVTELKGRTLLVKNQTKVKIENQKSTDFKTLRSLINMANEDKVLVLENLRWAMDFSCDQYCLAEVLFLQQMQPEYLYIAETDERASARAASILEDKYAFFVGFLDKDFLDPEFKKKLIWGLIDSLDKFRALQPEEKFGNANHVGATTQESKIVTASSVIDDSDSEVATLAKLFSNLNDLRKRLVIRYDSIKSAN
jgi:tetratricopeptide (TPR) repeat protein